jgi:hypothetical protein
MNCPTIDKLSQYVDQLLGELEMREIISHAKKCKSCSHVIEAFKHEQQFLKDTLKSPSLSDDFANKILDQLEPYEQKPKPIYQKRTLSKRMLFSAAAVVLAIGLGTTLNPSFAQWIGGLFTTEQVDEGLRMASEAGLAKRINREVTDQGITFKVEDVVADTSRVALSYQIIKDGKPQDTRIRLEESDNKIMGFDQNGKKIDQIGMGWTEGSEYGLIEFSLREQIGLEELRVKFDLTELNGVKGNWELEIPIDLKENLKYTTQLALNGKEFSSHGVKVDMKKMQFAPSSNELIYETAFTNEEKRKTENEIQQLEEKFGQENVQSFTNYGTAIQYHLENQGGKDIYKHNTFLPDQDHPSDVGLIQGSSKNMSQLGHLRWNESFIPQQGKEQLTFVLDGVVKTVPADFSVKISPEELRKNPVSFEYEGNYMTIKKAKKHNEFSLQKSLIPIDRKAVFQIEMEGGKEAPSSDLGPWVLTDNQGKTHLAFQSGSILNEKDENGRYKTTLDLKIYDMEKVPDEFTLHLLSVTRYKEIEEKWKVPLY